MFHHENVLDSFNYLSQDFSDPLNKKLCMWILEIQYQIVKNFTPEQIYMTKDQEKELRAELYQQQKEIDQRRLFYRSMRCSKFGTQLCIKRADGTRQMVNNIYQKSIETTDLTKKQRMKSNVIHGKKNKQNIIDGMHKIVEEAAMEDSDRLLLEIMRNYLDDVLENTYNHLINEVFRQLGPSSEMGRAELDNYHFFKFSAFMINVQRLKAYEDHANKQKAAFEEAKLATPNDPKDVKALFTNNKPKPQAPKL